jgi:hypothetical protein
MIMGMQMVWIFGDTADILKLPRPQVEGYLTYGGSELFFLSCLNDYFLIFFSVRCVWECHT